MKRRRWFELHSFVGIVCGIPMFLVCWSGTVAVLSHEIDAWLDPRVVAPAGVEAESPKSWQRLAEAARAHRPDATAMTLVAPLKPGYAAQAIVDTPAQAMQRVYLDPGTGAVLGATSYFNVQRFFRSLHMSLFDFGSQRGWGYWFVGAFGVLLLASTIAPLVFYRRWWRGFFRLETRHGSRVFWSDAHKLAGVWTLVFSFVIAVTGVWYLSEWFGVDFGYPERAPLERPAPARTLPLDAIVARAQAEWPGLRITSVTPAEGSWWGHVVHVEGDAEAALVRPRANYLMLDPASGAVLRSQRAIDLGWPARWVDTADPLHFGDFAGLPVKLVWFVFGLAMTGLTLSGAYLHVQRLRRSRGARWRATGVGIAVSIAVLGITAAGGAREIRGYGATIDGVAHWPEVAPAVLAFLAAWTLATIAIIVAWIVVVHRSGAHARDGEANRARLSRAAVVAEPS